MSAVLRLYAAAGSLARPGLRRMLNKRVARGKEIAGRLAERFGQASLPRPSGRLLWIHAASVGETMSVLPVIAALAGACEVLLTTGTATSAALGASRLPAYARHQFVPLDVTPWVENFLRHWRPDGAIFVESELWPAMLTNLDAQGIPRLLINARMSPRSARRWRLAPKLALRLLGGFRYIHAQSTRDAENLATLGLRDILQWGNLKFAAPILPADEAALTELRAQILGPLWLAASTHPGEETLVHQAHQALLQRFPSLITIIVPRHPERGAEIATLTAAPRRSLRQAPVAGQIYVADTLGELGLFYRLAPFAFIGGSLVPHGGQNVIEPARLARPVIAGPHTENFAAPVTLLQTAGALRTVNEAATLAAAVNAWLEDPAAATQAGIAAASTFAEMADLPSRIAKLILDISL